MNKFSISIVLMGLASVAAAQDESPARSIMFETQQNAPDYLTTIPENQKQQRGERCMELLRQADELKGKPQRRSAAMERWRQECELR